MSENTGGTPPQGDVPEPTTPQVPVPPTPPVPPTGAVPPPPPPAPGAYPPPPGAYPPPATPYGQPGQPGPGGYQAPPPGTYPPAGGYQGGPSSTQPIGEALTYGWNKFTQNGGTFIVAGLIWILGAFVVWGILFAILGGLTAVGGDDRVVGTGVSVLWSLLAAAGALLFFVVEAMFIRAALEVTYGRRIELSTFFNFADLGPIVITALLFAAISFVLTFIPFFGTLVSIAVNFFLFFTLFFVIDKKLPPIDAVKASVALVQANLSSTVLFYLLVVVIVGAGAALCGLGLFVAVPVALVASAYFYRRLLGENIAP